MNQSDHWTAYWNSGVLTSLPQDFKANYDGEVADFWMDVLAQLPQEARILDVCTGNLALPLLFCELNKQLNKQLSITALDRAEININALSKQHPEVAEYFQHIQVVPPTELSQMDALQLPEYDLISSQFGIEYADIETAAPVLFSQLKPGGHLIFVAHATETAITGFMKQERGAFELLQSLAVFDSFTAFSEGRMNPKTFQTQIKKALKKVHEALIQQPVQLLQIIHQALGGLSQLNLKQLISQKQKIGQFSSQHLMAQLRANDLLQVIEKMQNNPEWYAPFLASGLILESKEAIIYQGKHHAGTAFVFTKPM